MNNKAENVNVFDSKFKSMDDIITDKLFIQHVERLIRNTRRDYHNRPKLDDGLSYKRNWYDRFTDKGQMNADFFIKNIRAVWYEQSKLSRDERRIVKSICADAVTATVADYKKQQEKEAGDGVE